MARFAKYVIAGFGHLGDAGLLLTANFSSHAREGRAVFLLPLRPQPIRERVRLCLLTLTERACETR